MHLDPVKLSDLSPPGVNLNNNMLYRDIFNKWRKLLNWSGWPRAHYNGCRNSKGNLIPVDSVPCQSGTRALFTLFTSVIFLGWRFPGWLLGQVLIKDNGLFSAVLMTWTWINFVNILTLSAMFVIVCHMFALVQ